MSEIKCINNYIRLRDVFLKGEKGNAEYFTTKLQISKRTFHRFIRCLKEVEGVDIKFNKFIGVYYLD